MTDKLTPRQRLAHKLRDGKYRAKQLGCPVEQVSIKDAEHLLLVMTCYYCGCQLSGMYALEHKEPLKLGGAHKLSNLCLSCLDCNEEKHIQTELEYLARLDSQLFGRNAA